MAPFYQSTLAGDLSFSGRGVHSGRDVRLDIRPAPDGHGIVFLRHVASEGKLVRLPAMADFVGASDLCTTLEQGKGRVETIEHLMAAIAAVGLDNLVIESSEPELPILDGSAASFMRGFMATGTRVQQVLRPYIKILKPVRVEAGAAFAEFLPAETSSFDITIDFASKAIGRQRIAFDLVRDFFAREIAPARTFGFLKDAQKLRDLGLARGASLENSLIIGLDDKVMNPQGLLFADEFVRHKALDAVGDTALLGKPFIGLYRSFCGGHRLNIHAVKALLAATDCFEIVENSG